MSRPVILVDLDNVDSLTAWAAGLFEGEGCIIIQRPGGNKAINHNFKVCIISTDKDIIERFYKWANCGSTWRRSRAAFEDHWKDQWEWSASGEDALWIIERILPWLGERRTERAIEVLKLARDLQITGRNWGATQRRMVKTAARLLAVVEGGDAYVQ